MSRHYDNAMPVAYNLGLVDFGAGDTTYHIKAPYGFSKGRLREVSVDVTETFNAVTTQGFVRVGTTADPDAYAELQMGTAAAGAVWNGQDDTNAIINATIPDATDVEVDCVAPTGGVPAGIGRVVIVIEWW